MALSGRQFTISAGEHEATVVEVGAGLRRYAVGGKDITATYADDELPPRGCGAVLVPWPNRVRGGAYRFDGVAYQLPLTEPANRNAIHGLGRWARWAELRHSDASVSLGLDIPPQTGWPFELHVEMTYAVDATAGLSVGLTAHNYGQQRAPFGAGFHPYLSLDGHRLDDVTLLLPAKQHLVLDDAQIPVGVRSVSKGPHDFRKGKRLRALRLDDAYTDLLTADGRSAVDVRIGGGGARVWFDAAYPFVQVFTPEDLAHGAPAIAVEPMTCPADAFNSGTGLLVLEPSTSWTGSWGIQPLA